MIKIGFIDDNRFLINNYRSFLQDFQNISIQFYHSSFEEFESYVKKTTVTGVDVLIIDIGLPGLKGLDAITPVKQIFPNTRILMFTGYTDEYNVVESFRRGAVGYLIKSPRMMELYTAIIEVYNSGAYISSMAAAQLIKQVKFKLDERFCGILTKREIELVNYLQEGLSYKEIAARMYLSVYTVNYHLKNIYPKLNVDSKAQLISKIRNRGQGKSQVNSSFEMKLPDILSVDPYKI